MKNEEQPTFEWLQKHHIDEAAIQQYLPEFLLAEVYSPMILRVAQEQWNELPFYVRQSLDSEIVSLINNPVAATETALNQYWIRRAIHVLRGYADCPVPLSDDTRMKPLRRDLLSQKGHKRLCLLERALAENRATNQLGKQARSAAQKAGLDLSLFVDFEHLDTLSKGHYGVYKNIDVSMTSGCYNGCVHCGYEAKSPVSHMPYPIFLKIATKIYGNSNFNGFCYIYTDSDPITYRDSIINADSGDVILAMNSILKNKSKTGIQFVTKGVLTKRDEIAFGKVIHNANLFRFMRKKDWRPIMGLDISLVDLPGEAVDKNYQRVKRTLEICTDIDPKADITLRYYVIPEQKQLRLDELLLLPGITPENLHISGFDKVGRWAQKVKEGKIKKSVYDWLIPETVLTHNHYIISANLMLHDVYREGDKFTWQSLCSVFDKDFIRRLASPISLHPTVLRPIVEPNKFSTVVKKSLQRLFRGRDMTM